MPGSRAARNFRCVVVRPSSTGELHNVVFEGVLREAEIPKPALRTGASFKISAPRTPLKNKMPRSPELAAKEINGVSGSQTARDSGLA